jgi:hypothetical protein
MTGKPAASRQLTADERAAIAADYAAGVKLAVMSVEHRISADRIRSVVLSSGGRLRRPPVFGLADPTEAARAYLRGASLGAIARGLGISVSAVKTALIRAGVDLRDDAVRSPICRDGEIRTTVVGAGSGRRGHPVPTRFVPSGLGYGAFDVEALDPALAGWDATALPRRLASAAGGSDRSACGSPASMCAESAIDGPPDGSSNGGRLGDREKQMIRRLALAGLSKRRIAAMIGRAASTVGDVMRATAAE